MSNMFMRNYVLKCAQHKSLKWTNEGNCKGFQWKKIFFKAAFPVTLQKCDVFTKKGKQISNAFHHNTKIHLQRKLDASFLYNDSAKHLLLFIRDFICLILTADKDHESSNVYANW